MSEGCQCVFMWCIMYGLRAETGLWSRRLVPDPLLGEVQGTKGLVGCDHNVLMTRCGCRHRVSLAGVWMRVCVLIS